MPVDSGACLRTTSKCCRRDRTRFAIDLKQAAPPGTVWNYNNAAIQTLDRVISTATEQPTSQFGADRILKPIGMSNSSFTGGPNDSTLMFAGLQSTCPDLARFGLLAMRDGKWGDQQVVPSGWFTQAATPGSLNPAYGFPVVTAHRGARSSRQSAGPPRRHSSRMRRMTLLPHWGWAARWSS
ncbi:MAG: serine hydrolase [Candidatus Microthrix sp.]|nr:serine hydrolase [Candidatus Microthrix sp.]